MYWLRPLETPLQGAAVDAQGRRPVDRRTRVVGGVAQVFAQGLQKRVGGNRQDLQFVEQHTDQPLGPALGRMRRLQLHRRQQQLAQ